MLKGTKALGPHGLSSQRKDFFFVAYLEGVGKKATGRLGYQTVRNSPAQARQACNPDLQRIALILFQHFKLEWRKGDMFQNLRTFEAKSVLRTIIGWIPSCSQL